jgi:hypothetical protein
MNLEQCAAQGEVVQTPCLIKAPRSQGLGPKAVGTGKIGLWGRESATKAQKHTILHSAPHILAALLRLPAFGAALMASLTLSALHELLE